MRHIFLADNHDQYLYTLIYILSPFLYFFQDSYVKKFNLNGNSALEQDRVSRSSIERTNLKIKYL